MYKREQNALPKESGRKMKCCESVVTCGRSEKRRTGRGSSLKLLTEDACLLPKGCKFNMVHNSKLRQSRKCVAIVNCSLIGYLSSAHLHGLPLVCSSPPPSAQLSTTRSQKYEKGNFEPPR